MGLDFLVFRENAYKFELYSIDQNALGQCHPDIQDGIQCFLI